MKIYQLVTFQSLIAGNSNNRGGGGACFCTCFPHFDEMVFHSLGPKSCGLFTKHLKVTFKMV